MRNLCVLFALTVLVVAAVNAHADDLIMVNLPYRVTAGNVDLTPGEYIIRHMANSPVLFIYGDHGMKFETAVWAIPAVRVDVPEESKVILNRDGEEYVLNKIWIQGQNTGYELIVPEKVRSRQRERNLSASNETAGTVTLSAN